MTVKELIEELKKFNGDVEVVAHVDGQDADYPIDPKPSIYGSACLSRFGGGWQVFAKEGVISLNVSQKPSDQIVWSEPGQE